MFSGRDFTWGLGLDSGPDQGIRADLSPEGLTFMGEGFAQAACRACMAL